jgi:hypothetical protein
MRECPLRYASSRDGGHYCCATLKPCHFPCPFVVGTVAKSEQASQTVITRAASKPSHEHRSCRPTHNGAGS